MKILLLCMALAACGHGQSLPDAPSAPQPSVFGSTPGAKTSSTAVNVTESEAASHVLTRPTQVYPPAASTAKLEGDVVVQAIIDTNGNVAAVKALSGPQMLAPAAVAYVKEWIFRPFYSGSTRVPAVTQITVHYSLFASQAEREMQKHFYDTYWPAWNAGEAALAKKDYAAAREQYEIARAEAAKLGMANWQELANALARLGAVEYRQKNYPAAEPYLLQALQLQQNHREQDAPEVADALGNLGELYMAENNFGKAEPLFLRAVEIYDQHLQAPAPKIAAAGWKRHRVLDLFMLGSLNQELGASDDALKYCDQASYDAPNALPKDEAIIVLRTCETVYRKNLKFTRAREVESVAKQLEGASPVPATTPANPPQK